MKIAWLWQKLLKKAIKALLGWQKKWPVGIESRRRALWLLFLGLIWFGLVWFYGISTVVGHLMPNSFLYIKHFYFKQFSLTKVQFFCLHTAKCKNSSISNRLAYVHSLDVKNSYIPNNSYCSISTQLKCSKEFNFKLFSLVNKVKWFQVLLYITKNLVKYQSLIYK